LIKTATVSYTSAPKQSALSDVIIDDTDHKVVSNSNSSLSMGFNVPLDRLYVDVE